MSKYSLKPTWCWKSESTSDVVFSVLSKLGSVSLVSVSSGLGSDSNDSGVDSAGDAVLLFDVDLGQLEVVWSIISVVIFDISLWGTVDHVSHLESLDSFILWENSTTVEASNDVRMSLVLFTSSVISSLGWHLYLIIQNNPKYP